MHLMIPYASTLDDDGLRRLQLPHLSSLLGLFQVDGEALGSDETAARMPHELALEVWQAPPPSQHDVPPWARLTPMHFSVSTDQVTALDPQVLQLTDPESQAFFDVLAPLFAAEDGWQHQWQGALDWRVAHAQFRGLDKNSSASLDRLVNRSLTPWMPQARPLRRLLNEVQMSLHEHPLNQAREARGQLPVNAVWISDVGPCRDASAPFIAPDLVFDPRLRPAWLAGDWAAWAQAWQALDHGPVRALLQALQDGASPAELSLTLCGERLARRFKPTQRSPWQRLWHLLKAPQAHVHAVLESL